MNAKAYKERASFSELVDESRRRASFSIFSSPDIHALEIDRIFNRTWLFLAHESEIPEAGDHVVRPMAADEVIVLRGEDGRIRAFLNSCRHRGVPLCRTDAGRTRRFVCPYHGWTYDTTGKLRTTSFDDFYDKADLGDLNLVPVPHLDTVNGLIFGCWDPRASSLADHLGDLRWYLDLLFARTPGGMSVIAPPQRWIIETNWKIPAINFMDTQHALRTHAGPLTMAQQAGAPPLSEVIKGAARTPLLTFPQGHGIVPDQFATLFPPFFGFPPDLVSLYERTLGPEKFCALRDLTPMVGTIFPMTSWVTARLAVGHETPPTTFLSLRNWQPRGPDKIEVWNWYFVEKEASDDWRRRTHRIALQTFGQGGVLEEDDAEAWATLARAIKGPNASRAFMDFSAGRGENPLPSFTSPGTVYPSLLTDHAQWGFLMRWKRQMENAIAEPAE